MIALVILSGCDKNIKSPVDASERVFAVIHFSGHTKQFRKLSVTNGNDVFYIDDGELKKYGSDNSFCEADEIMSMSANDDFLFVLNQSGNLIRYDIERASKTEFSSEFTIDDFFVTDRYIFIACKDDGRFYAFSAEDDCLSADTATDLTALLHEENAVFGSMDTSISYISSFNNIVIATVACNERDGKISPGVPVVFDNGQPRALPESNKAVYLACSMFAYNNTLCYVNKGCCFIQTSNSLQKAHYNYEFIDYLCNECQVYRECNVVYELLQIPNYSDSEKAHQPYQFNPPQYYVLNDVLVSTDLATGTSQTIYMTENANTRIIGYSDGTVYLFDATNYTVNTLDLCSGEIELLSAVPDEYNTMRFEWCADILLIYSADDNVIFSIVA